MTTRVVVLGPPDIHSPGPQMLGPRLSRLLGILAASNGTPVRTGVLVDRVWPTDAPGSGDAALRVQVTRLRRLLGSSDSIVASPGRGYSLQTGGGNLTLDSAEFGDLVKQADQHVAAGRHQDAAGTYRSALALWNGMAFDGCDDDTDVRIAQAGLDALRQQARRSLVASSFIGHADEATIDLTDLHHVVAEDPGDEELASVFMEGLANRGHPNEALRIYIRTKTHLHSELGVDPSAKLTALAQRLWSGPTSATHG